MKARILWVKSGAYATAGLLAMTMSACGGDAQQDTTSADSAPPQATSSPDISNSQPPAASPAPSQSDSSSPSAPDAQAHTQALLQAGRTGLQQVANSTVYSIESENEGDRWEVEVVTADGTKHEMYVSRDGSQVVQPPTTDGQEAEYRERIEGAKLDFEKAVDIIVGQVPGARLQELGLDHENGTIVWEADVVNESAIARSLEIDAATGKVLENKLDT